MKKLLVGVLIAIGVAGAAAAPKARSAGECTVIGNMVFIAGVFARHGWSEADALKLFPDMYATLYGERRDAHEIARLAVAAAYANLKKNPDERPIVFGAAVAVICTQFRGDLDDVLGGGTS